MELKTNQLNLFINKVKLANVCLNFMNIFIQSFLILLFWSFNSGTSSCAELNVKKILSREKLTDLRYSLSVPKI